MCGFYVIMVYGAVGVGRCWLWVCHRDWFCGVGVLRFLLYMECRVWLRVCLVGFDDGVLAELGLMRML